MLRAEIAIITIRTQMHMSAAPSTLSLIAAMFYCAVAALGGLALFRAIVQQQLPWHRWGWAMVVALFVVLAIVRVFSVEDWIRGDLREVLIQGKAYDTRRAVQGPLSAILFLISAAGFASLFYYIRRGIEGRRNVAILAALGCTSGMLLLFGLRIVSLHSVDALLFGPLKLNWFLDIGLSATVAICAVRYRAVVRRK
ncbi:hypothetical protein ACLBKU_07190 [Erythrobacter sp. NE805]|uniref:hypothetical protein n=1 Tax=Erythrobacter sp. NE805 TaxID=3389875 RepID=UPI00396B2F87